MPSNPALTLILQSTRNKQSCALTNQKWETSLWHKTWIHTLHTIKLNSYILTVYPNSWYNSSAKMNNKFCDKMCCTIYAESKYLISDLDFQFDYCMLWLFQILDSDFVKEGKSKKETEYKIHFQVICVILFWFNFLRFVVIAFSSHSFICTLLFHNFFIVPNWLNSLANCYSS